MDTNCYPITILPHLSRLFTDFAQSETALQPFFPVSPSDEAWAARAVNFSGERYALATLLEAQNQSWGASPATLQNISRLRAGASVVVTGQQVVLFGGPLFVLYKAATAVARAQATGAVPIFWLATEDHDLDEADHIALAAPPDLRTLRLETTAAPAQPVGSIPLGPGIESVLDQAAEILGDVPEIDLLRETYRPGVTFAEAFARLILKIFARQGLIVIDASSRAFHAAGAAVLQAAIERAEEFETLLHQRDQLLAGRGYHSQVLVAKNSSLLFLVDKETRARQALKRDASGQWIAGKSTCSTADLLAILRAEPERLSPNALLRPVFQDAILPTLAYIGGPAEVAYFAQTQVLYQAILGHTTPILPRLSATIVEASLRNSMAKHGVSLQDILHTRPEELTQRLGARTMPVEGKQQLAATGNALDRELTALVNWMRNMDAGLGRSAETSASKMRYQMNRLRRMAANFQLQQDESLRRHVEKLYAALYPKHHLQERAVAAISYLGKYGDVLVDAALEAAAELCPGHREIHL
ncbi:MAG: bacillithiol biosynthesis cysteine-adding enzyme BshC [Acidobacteriaceae bacterium]